MKIVKFNHGDTEHKETEHNETSIFKVLRPLVYLNNKRFASSIKGSARVIKGYLSQWLRSETPVESYICGFMEGTAEGRPQVRQRQANAYNSFNPVINPAPTPEPLFVTLDDKQYKIVSFVFDKYVSVNVATKSSNLDSNLCGFYEDIKKANTLTPHPVGAILVDIDGNYRMKILFKNKSWCYHLDVQISDKNVSFLKEIYAVEEHTYIKTHVTRANKSDKTKLRFVYAIKHGLVQSSSYLVHSGRLKINKSSSFLAFDITVLANRTRGHLECMCRAGGYGMFSTYDLFQRTFANSKKTVCSARWTRVGDPENVNTTKFVTTFDGKNAYVNMTTHAYGVFSERNIRCLDFDDSELFKVVNFAKVTTMGETVALMSSSWVHKVFVIKLFTFNLLLTTAETAPDWRSFCNVFSASSHIGNRRFEEGVGTHWDHDKILHFITPFYGIGRPNIHQRRVEHKINVNPWLSKFNEGDYEVGSVILLPHLSPIVLEPLMHTFDNTLNNLTPETYCKFVKEAVKVYTNTITRDLLLGFTNLTQNNRVPTNIIHYGTHCVMELHSMDKGQIIKTKHSYCTELPADTKLLNTDPVSMDPSVVELDEDSFLCIC